MTSKRALILACFSVFALGHVSSTTDKVFCYFASWSIYYESQGKFVIEDFDPSACTHILYAFADITKDGSIEPSDSEADIDLGGYKKVNALKKQNKALKTLLSVGGWSAGSATFSKVAADASKRSKFVTNAVKFLSSYGFDGLDVDWEYPGQRDGSSSKDKENFVSLLKELRKEFDLHGYILSAAVSSEPSSKSYDVPEISKSLDYINVMTYDFHGPDDGVAGENAPLYGNDGDNVDSSVKAWIDKGADAKKITLGVAFYGHSYKLKDSGNHDVGAKTTGPGNGGPYMDDKGSLGYNEICYLQQQGGWTTKLSDEQQVPYMYKGDQWVGYDDVDSITKKVNYAKGKDLAGIMIWSIDTDDFTGVCGAKLPLLKAVKKSLQ